MKKNMILSFLILATALSLGGCSKSETTHVDETATIKPAIPPSTTERDAVTTQTTEIGEERSPNEGGDLTNPNLPSASPSATASPTTTR